MTTHRLVRSFPELPNHAVFHHRAWAIKGSAPKKSGDELIAVIRDVDLPGWSVATVHRRASSERICLWNYPLSDIGLDRALTTARALSSGSSLTDHDEEMVTPPCSP